MLFILTYTDIAARSAITPKNKSAVIVAIAEHNIRMIVTKFSTLVAKSRKKLQMKNIDIEDVQDFLITMYSSPNSKDGDETVTKIVESAESLKELIRKISRKGLWDYLNYGLLQSIIEGFASDDGELNEMMEHYKEALTGHILTLKIQTYLEATHDEHPNATSDSEMSGDEIVPSLPPLIKLKLFKKLSMKVDVHVADYTLDYVIDLWQSLRKQFKLPRPAMILDRIAEGCICITWLIPANLETHVTRMVRETSDMFAEQQILRVTLDEQCIYPMETLTEQPLPVSETATFKIKVCFLYACNTLWGNI